MKRLFPLFLVVCLIFVMAVPAFASDGSDQVMISGPWCFNETLSFPDYVQIPAFGNTVVFEKIVFPDGSYMTFSLYNTGDDIIVIRNNGNTVYNYSSSKWILDVYRHITFGDSPVFVSQNFYDWLTANGSPEFCDSSVCSSVDSNFDYVCDVCGSPFSFSSRTYSYLETVTFRTSSSDFIKVNYMSLSPIAIRGFIDGDSYRVDAESPVWVTAYTSSNNYDWVETYSGDLSTHYPSDNLDDEVISSTFDWYTSSSGDLFFPLPLWTTVSNSAQRGMADQQQAVVGTMKILALCGVGCLTLLVVLKLFGKRSLISRS